MANIIEIHSIDAPEAAIFCRLTEAQLRNRLEPEKGIFIAESPKVINSALNAGCVPVSILTEHKHIEGQARSIIERCGNIPVYTGTNELLQQITGYELTRGVLCAMRRPHLKSVEEICRNGSRIVVADNVVNSTNTGAIFRAAAALGIDAILLTPTCCDPLNRRAVRVSMGTVFQIPWTYIGNTFADWPERGMQQLHDLGFKTMAMALNNRAIYIDDPILKQEERLAIIMGTEGNGLQHKTIDLCDYNVMIPMHNGVDSLNVAAAAAVAFWELRKR